MDKSYVDYIVDYLNMAYDHYNLKYINVYRNSRIDFTIRIVKLHF